MSSTRGGPSRARAALALGLAVALVSRPAAAQSADPDPWWGPDKALHFTLSAVIAGGGYAVASIFTDQRPIRLAVGGGLALLAGGAKELIDLAGGGTASWKDFTWDVIGCATGLLIAFLLDVFVITPLTQPAPAPAP
jgi:putative lipoprotein